MYILYYYFIFYIYQIKCQTECQIEYDRMPDAMSEDLCQIWWQNTCEMNISWWGSLVQKVIFGVFVKALWPLMNQDEPSLPVVPATESLSRQLGGGSERPLWGEAPDEPTEWHGIWPYRRWLPENLSPEVRLASLLTMQFCYFGAKAAAIDGFGPSGATHSPSMNQEIWCKHISKSGRRLVFKNLSTFLDQIRSTFRSPQSNRKPGFGGRS